MKLVRVFIVGWVSGWVAGLVMAERWRRLGGDSAPMMPNAVESVESGTADRVPTIPRVSTVIVSGARADYERGRLLLRRVVPWTSTSAPSLADLRGRVTMTTRAESDAPDASPQV